MKCVRSRKRIIWVVVGGVFIVALVLGLFLVLRKDYRGAGERVQGMLAVEKQVKGLAGVEEITEKDLSKVEEALAGIRALKTENVKLGKSSALKDEEVGKQYERIKTKVEKWEELAQVGNILLKIAQGDASDSLAKMAKELKQTQNKQLQEMGEDLENYQKQVKDFREKYQSGKAEDYTKMQEEYGVVVAKGEEIKTKYEKMDFEKYTGMSEKKMLSIFDDLKKLKKYLAERS